MCVIVTNLILRCDQGVKRGGIQGDFSSPHHASSWTKRKAVVRFLRKGGLLVLVLQTRVFYLTQPHISPLPSPAAVSLAKNCYPKGTSARYISRSPRATPSPRRGRGPSRVRVTATISAGLALTPPARHTTTHASPCEGYCARACMR